MQLINGDCLEELKHIPDKSVDMVICDLPYGITDFKWDKKIDINQLWSELCRVGKPNTPYFFFCTLNFGIEIINANPKMFKTDFVWNKTRMTNALCARYGINRSHETILMFYDKKPIYNMMKYHTKQSSGRSGNISSSCREDIFDGTKAFEYTPRLPLSVMDYNPLGKKSKALHRTGKPVEILETLIKYYSNEGDTILDPTMGSGSTGVACNNLGRQFIGIELNKDIFEVAKKRLE
jgi:DNA modification methylase